MKKILFSSAAAIFAVIGLSSYSSKLTNYYWFNVQSGTDNTPTTYAGRNTTDVSPANCSGATNFCQNSYLTASVHSTVGGGFAVNKTQNGVDFVAPFQSIKKS